MSAPPDGLPRRIEKPWGYEIWYAWTDRYAGKLLHVRPGGRLSLQYHERKDESSYVLRGRLWLTRGRSLDQLTVVEVGEGFAWRNPPGEIHTLVVPDDCVEMVTFFNIGGAMIYLDDAGRQTGYEDVFSKIEMCRRHYADVGLGAGYVDQFIR